MKSLIIIPARYNSNRFPGKPLALIKGLPMLLRVYLIAKFAAPEARVVIATDDDRIVEFARTYNAETVLTSDYCNNGSERAALVIKYFDEKFDYVINFQGDAVLTPPWIISELLNHAALHNNDMITAATRMNVTAYEKLKKMKQSGQVGGTTVVFDRNFKALYFSKAIIPNIRVLNDEMFVWRHIGIYGYRPDILTKLASLAPGLLEQSEQLEQLRALEYGIPIHVVPVQYHGRTHWGVDTVEDLVECENIIDREGELLHFRKILDDHTMSSR